MMGRVIDVSCQRDESYSTLSAQMWATAEAATGNLRAAREKFSASLSLDPGRPHVHCAWARMEASAAGDVDRAREIFQEGAMAVPKHAPLLNVRAPCVKAD